MKELTIEEKAKRFDEVIEKAKIWQEHLYDVNDKDYADELNYIFPELKESEEEQIFFKCVEALEDFGKFELADWLKSTKERYIWKPSEYELKVLKLAAEKDGACLMGLYEELKKLREE